MTDKIADDELFVQIVSNQKKMLDLLLSHEAEITRIKLRVDRLEDEGRLI